VLKCYSAIAGGAAGDKFFLVEAVPESGERGVEDLRDAALVQAENRPISLGVNPSK
jgi:hypothetical protein